MLAALRVAKYSLGDLWDDLAVLVSLNVAWSLCLLLPVLPIFWVTEPIPLVMVTLVLALPLPVASGALCHVANQVARGRVATWGLFAEGIRRYWVKSLAVAALNLVALVLLAANLVFYGWVVAEAWAKVALSAWLVVGVFWGLVQIYWFPMILETKSEQVLDSLRRAAGLVVISPGFGLLVGIIVVLLILVCVLTAIPGLTILASLLLLLINHATRSRLASAQKKPYHPHGIEPS